MPSCLSTGVHHLKSVYKGDNHHKDPMIFFPLTSSRIDSIRASQRLVDYIVLSIINVMGHISGQRPSNKVL